MVPELWEKHAAYVFKPEKMNKGTCGETEFKKNEYK
jgi:hypothetical protein